MICLRSLSADRPEAFVLMTPINVDGRMVWNIILSFVKEIQKPDKTTKY